MANPDIVNGFTPWGRCLRINPYTAESTIYKGDLVKLNANGTVEPCAAGTTPAVGVAMNYAAAAAQVLVADDPDQLFVAQSDDGTIDALTDMGLNYNITVGTASTLYRRSGMEIDGNTGVTDSNLPVKVLRLLPAVDNALGTNAKVICKINNHKLGSGGDVGTLGV